MIAWVGKSHIYDLQTSLLTCSGYRPHHKRRSAENHLKTCEALWRPPDDSPREEKVRQTVTVEKVGRKHRRLDRKPEGPLQRPKPSHTTTSDKRWRHLVHRSSMQCPYDPGCNDDDGWVYHTVCIFGCWSLESWWTWCQLNFTRTCSCKFKSKVVFG